MAALERFEDIIAWQKARELAKEVYHLTSEHAFSRDYGLRDQIRKAAVSVMSNIAEGYGRGGNKEFLRFLRIAKGSVHEVKSQLYVAMDTGYIGGPQFDSASSICGETERLIGGFIRYLQKRSDPGQVLNSMKTNHGDRRDNLP